MEENKTTNKPNKSSDKTKELENQIEKLTETLKTTQSELNEMKIKATQYLQTASYYKNDAESQKKDFERYKERNKNIESDAITKANESVAKKLLPIIDNFDQAISHCDPEVLKGFTMIYSSLIETLADLGVKEVTCKNEELNPEFHNCISTETTDDDSLDGKIASVYQKGYMFADTQKVIRAATVSVYKK